MKLLWHPDLKHPYVRKLFLFFPFRYWTLVLLFHQWLSEFQRGIYFGAACATADLSDGVPASEISWWVQDSCESWAQRAQIANLVSKGRACLPKSSLPLLEVKLGSGKVLGIIAQFLELITQLSINHTVDLLCRKRRQWDISTVLSAKGQECAFFL